MAFWSGETLKNRLAEVIENNGGDEARIECASYQLRLGGQVFVTRDRSLDDEQNRIQHLTNENNLVTVPPGQFAFLLTEESVSVPADAFALISMRSGRKFQGLINVSGFHVDPGYKGQLVFGVYNAGPQNIVLSKGEELFLIVFADLDRKSDQIKKVPGYAGIRGKWVEGMTEQVFSPMFLKRQMERLTEEHRDMGMAIASMKGRDAFHMGLSGIALTFVAIAVAAGVAVTTSDWAKASAGMWITEAQNAYRDAACKDTADSVAQTTVVCNSNPPANVPIAARQGSGASTKTKVPAGN